MINKSEDTHSFHPSILRAYDIRGILEETLSEKDAYYIGLAYGSFIAEEGKQKRVCVAFDGRLSSPALEEKLVRGLQETGVDVVRIGLGPTPLLYFSVQHLKADGGIMITGSHNPPTHNGFKMMLAKTPVFGEDIQKLGKIVANGNFVEGKGSVSFEDVKEDYLAHLVAAYKGKKDLKVVWDAGNGAAGEIMSELASRLPGEHFLLNEKIDGTFPSHHPDPSVLENMQQLIAKVLQEGCDLGIAFDGDGDRVGVVDDKGNMIFGDQLMVMLSESVLAENPGETIIADVKASQVLFDEIAKNGGKPLMWQTGHSLIKTKMFETGAILAGEMSGHIFFKENFGFDDGPYAAIKLLNILTGTDKKLSAKVAEIPSTFNTPEIRVYVDDAEKFDIVESVKNEAVELGLDVNDVDGARALIHDGWWLIRASNTEASLVLRCESKSEDGLAKIKESIFGLLKRRGVEV